VRATLIAAGTVIMGYALVGALTDPDVRLLGVAVFLAAVLVAHDGVLLPLTLGVGALVGRYVPADARTTVRAAAVCSLAVTVVAMPLVLGHGRSADNPSALPLPYGRGLLVVLGTIWTAAFAAIAIQRIRKRFERPRELRDPSATG
jgi:hypothetical protein